MRLKEMKFEDQIVQHLKLLDHKGFGVTELRITVPSNEIVCDLAKIESCEFIKWCRKYPMDVSEPLWFAMVTNLAQLKGEPELFHEISCLDMFRYNY